MSILSKIFGDSNERFFKSVQSMVDKINSLEPKFGSFSVENLKAETEEFRKRLKDGKTLDEILPEAFALVREASKRTLGQRHYDVQLIGGIALHQGKIAEMKTGEGKTLASTLAVYLNALSERGVHVVTVNDYLAKRDAVWMGQIYYLLGLNVGCIAHEQAFLYDPEYSQEKFSSLVETSKGKQIQNSKPEDGKRDEMRDELGSFKVEESYLRPVSRKEAYQADITYGTNNEFGFDYLRDNMAYGLRDMVQRGFHYAIVDEIDSILIDEARTPLIISMPDTEAPKLYEKFAKIVPQLKENIDYNIDEKMKAATLTEEGMLKMEKILGIGNIWQEKGVRYVHHLEEALKAQVIFQKDRDYIVKNGKVIIVDEFTGRLLPGRRYSGGLHQAIEAKEGVSIQPESRTLATITFQNYFRMYGKLAGMTGTAATSAEEFYRVYNLDVVVVPTNKPMIRIALPDSVYRTENGKFKALVREIKKCHQKGQPVLVGTTSIEKNEFLGTLLEREGISHQILNAKHHEKEGAIIAQAGKFGAVTVATNMAGRGVDIILGGNPANPGEAEKVKELGGLHVVGTERHEARRIDNQLRGRSGRQGDPGSSQFFVSLEDDLMRIFGGDRVKSLMQKMGVPEDQPIENKLISGAIESAQGKIEGYNFDIRKHVLEYDEVLNKHRDRFYKMRREILALREWEYKDKVLTMIENEIGKIVEFHTQASLVEDWNIEEIFESIKAIFPVSDEVHQELSNLTMKQWNNETMAREEILKHLIDLMKQSYQEKEEEIGSDNMRQIEKTILLRTLDMLWMEHLENMEHLRDSVRLRAYGQRDPLVEYKNEGHRFFQKLLVSFETTVVNMIFKVGLVPRRVPRSLGEVGRSSEKVGRPSELDNSRAKIGRNDPCPCGAKKEGGRPIKYKHCCGKNA